MSDCSKVMPSPTGPRVILSRIDFAFDKRDRVGILADPGIGRDTLIRLLLGLEMPDSGQVTRPAGLISPIGSTNGFHPALSGCENVRLVAGALGEDPERASLYVHEFAELGEAYWQPMGSYTGAMRAQLGFAFSMAMPAATYLSDETVGVGNGRFRAKCQAALARRLADAGLVLFSARPRTTASLCNRHAVLRDGALLVCDTHAQATALFEVDRDDREAEEFAGFFDVC